MKNSGSAIEHQYNNEIPWPDYGDALGYYLEAQKDSKGKVISHKIVAIKTEDCLKSERRSDKVDSSNDKRFTTMIKVVRLLMRIERDHFRSTHDTGAHANAMLIMNAMRSELGLVPLTLEDLPEYSEMDREYIMPEDSNLLSNNQKDSLYKFKEFASWQD